MAERITVFARTDRFNPSRPCYSRMLAATLPWPTDYTPDLIEPALRLLDAIFRPGLTFQKCGVMLTALCPAERVKRDLFEARDPELQARLMQALDRLNVDYGARTVHFGDLGGAKARAAMRSGFKSRNYTTAWGELPVVR